MSENPSAAAQTHAPATVRERYLQAAIVFVTAITYVRVLGFEFVYDDQTLILVSPLVKSWHSVADYLVSPLWGHSHALVSAQYYRPLSLLLLRANYAIFQDHPFGWHGTTVLLHILVTWLVYILIRKMTGQVTLAWLSALIFGVHPIHHEVVAWVAGSMESLFAAMFLMAFLAYLKSLEGSKALWMAASCGFYALAMLSKETAVILPAMVFAHSWIEQGSSENGQKTEPIRRLKRALAPTVAYLPVVLAYLLVRHWIFSGVIEPASGQTIISWLLTIPSILLFYARNWFVPVGLSEFYDVYSQRDWSLTNVFFPVLVLFVLVGILWILRKRFGERTLGHAVAWIMIPLAPSLDTFVFRPDQLVHDRYFYLPSIGAALLVALIITRMAGGRVSLLGERLRVLCVGIALALVLSLLAARATTFWENNYALYLRGHQVAPQNTTATDNLGAELFARGQLDAAQTVLEEGFQRDKDFGIAFNLGRIGYAKRQYSQAEAYTRDSIALAPYFADAYVSLGQIELKQSRPAEAQASMRRAVELNPDSGPFHTTYGIVLALNGDCSGATEQFQTALHLNPVDASAQGQLGRCGAPAAPSPVAGVKTDQR
jgi:tetratricopeptide (TPR) repeat protein